MNEKTPNIWVSVYTFLFLLHIGIFTTAVTLTTLGYEVVALNWMVSKATNQIEIMFDGIFLFFLPLIIWTLIYFELMTICTGIHDLSKKRKVKK